MSSLFDDLKQGLEEAIDYEKGNGKAKETLIDTSFLLMNILNEGNFDKTDFVIVK